MARALIRAPGLKAALRDLRAVNAGAADEVLDLLYGRAGQAAKLAAQRAPRGQRVARRRRGRPKQPLADSLKALRTARGGAVISRKPYANIQEEGGWTPSHQSSSTRRKAFIPAKHYVGEVLVAADPLIAADLERTVIRLFERHGIPV